MTFTPNINFKDKIYKTDVSLTLDVSEAMKKSSQAIFCMRFDLATPSDPLADGTFVLGRYEFNKPDEFAKSEDDKPTTAIQFTFPSQPNVIWHATRFIFK